MNQRTSLLLLALIGALFFGGISWLYRLRLSGGDVFPAYSSLRADPLGARAFYEALAEVPGMTIERWTRSLQALPIEPARTILLAGMNRRDWATMSNEEAQHLDALARAGSRVIVAFLAERKSEIPAASNYDTDKEAAKRKRLEKEEAKRESELPLRLQHVHWDKLWGIELKDRFILDHDEGALRRAAAPTILPEHIPWKSDVYFVPSDGMGWSTLYTRGSSPVVMERVRGRGALVLATDSYFLSNEALNDHRFPTLLAWIAGSHDRVVFVESHLGLEEDIGVAALARRYGLAGCFFVLLLLSVLWVWQRMALFVPPAPSVDQLSLTYHQTAGLEALLRRAVPLKQLVATCATEWRSGARAGDATKLETGLAALPPDVSPVDAYNTAVRTLRRRI